MIQEAFVIPEGLPTRGEIRAEGYHVAIEVNEKSPSQLGRGS